MLDQQSAGAPDLNDFRSTLKASDLRIMPAPSAKEVQANLYLINDLSAVPILLAAMKAKVDYLTTHNGKWPSKAQKAGRSATQLAAAPA
jgi:hypothetical protein